MEQRRDHGLDAYPRFTGAGQLVANEHARDGSRELDVEMSAKRIDQAAWELACRIDRDLQSIHMIIDPGAHFLCPPHSDREHAVCGSDNLTTSMVPRTSPSRGVSHVLFVTTGTSLPSNRIHAILMLNR